MVVRARIAAATAVAVVALAGTGAASAAAANHVLAWGDNTGVQRSYASVPIADGLSGVTTIAPGGEHTLALLEDATVVAWGGNGYGQLGNSGAGLESRTPVPVEGLSEVTALAAGGNFSLALLADGTVRAWGGDSAGQLGIGGSETEHETPVEVSDLSGVRAIAAGGTHALALLSDGTVMIWGSGGGAESRSPVAVAGLEHVRAIAAGGEASYALLEDGTVRAWGSDQVGQLGTGDPSDHETPEPVQDLADVRAISADENDAGALLEDGSVMTWGRNQDGQLGNGSDEYKSEVPVEVSGLHDATALAVGGELDVALLEGGTVAAWGLDPGDGTGVGSQKDTPTSVCGASDIVAVAAGGFEQTFRQLNTGSAYAIQSAPGPLCAGPGGFEPSWGPPGTTLRVEGANVGEATEVKLGAVGAHFTVDSIEELTVVVPPGAGYVPVTVVTQLNEATSEGNANVPYVLQNLDYSYAVAPTFGGCERSETEKGGLLEDSNCTKPATGQEHEWLPYPGGTSLATTGAALSMETAGVAVACRSSSARGTFADDKTITGLVLKLSECERAGQKCTSLGEAQGTVTADPLVALLGFSKLGKTTKKDELGLEFSPMSGSFAEFTCGSTPVTVRGSVVAQVTPVDKQTHKVTFTLKASKGKQKLTGLLEMPLAALETSVEGGEFQGTTVTGKMSFNTGRVGAGIEINAVV
jgi:alpha-tubulin suppressor-like RCC1 family protein